MELKFVWIFVNARKKNSSFSNSVFNFITMFIKFIIMPAFVLIFLFNFS